MAPRVAQAGRALDLGHRKVDRENEVDTPRGVVVCRGGIDVGCQIECPRVGGAQSAVVLQAAVVVTGECWVASAKLLVKKCRNNGIS